MNIGFRVDGGKGIGMGHIMRCMSLAKEFKNKNCTVYFLSKVRDGIEKLESELFNVITLRGKKDNIVSDTGSLNNETIEMIEKLEEYNIDLLIIDTYMVDEDYFQTIKPYINKIAYIDDLNKMLYPVDILINGNLTAKHNEYEEYHNEELMFLGIEYNLIRDEFRDLPKRVVNEKVKNIMITTGATDSYNVSDRMISWILNDKYFRNIKINLVIGSGFRNIEGLQKLSNDYNNLFLHRDVSHMSRLMLDSDIAISAGGSTLYELCACGTPTLSFIMADNQNRLVREFDGLGYIQSLGWYNHMDEQEFITHLKSLCKDYERRTYLSGQIQGIVDGYGTKRIVEKVMQYIAKE